MTSYSPTLGVLTAIFELAAAAWIFRLGGRRAIQWGVAALLVVLAGYQILEVVICWNEDVTPTSPRVLFWSRMAFLDVTWLPPIGLWLTSKIYPSRALRRYAAVALGLAAIMSLWIVMDTRFITGTICEFMFAKYKYIEPYFHIYGAFYEVTQLSLVAIPAVLIVRSNDPVVRAHLGDLMMGALSFIVPALFLGAVLPEIFNMGLPSVMCHFALFYAIFLVRLARREHRSFTQA